MTHRHTLMYKTMLYEKAIFSACIINDAGNGYH